MSSIQRMSTAHLANADAARVSAAFGSTSVICWLPVIAEAKPVTMGYHRSRHLRRPSP
ncbi:MAG TPA: hypothetical protein VMW08_10420 [Acidimicrobiales bacterium]|nr:hypothetical protein [Acidimicrobiales bacterium]